MTSIEPTPQSFKATITTYFGQQIFIAFMDRKPKKKNQTALVRGVMKYHSSSIDNPQQKWRNMSEDFCNLLKFNSVFLTHAFSGSIFENKLNKK